MSISAKYNVMDVCRHVVNYSNETKNYVDNLKLQKLLYFIQALFLLKSDGTEACFEEELYAWAYGPVVPVAYGSFKEYGNYDIPSVKEYFEYKINEHGMYSLVVRAYKDDVISEEDKKDIDSLLERFKEYSGPQLIEITHAQDPWKNVYDSRKRDIIITKESVYKYFSSKSNN